MCIILTLLSEIKHSAVNGLNSDDIFKTKGKVSVYVDFKNNTDNSSIVPEVACPPQVPLELIVGTVRLDDLSESTFLYSRSRGWRRSRAVHHRIPQLLLHHEYL